ncbi:MULTISPECIES: hypothetical protein [unclassified Serratia (in: enterobacteria)]|uniref:hypothetical protein n=1 Tax=unclassified Serratia (in: enterobacteria) TaxID=2647522 RepID=UPI00117BA0AB|nr:MULTISPECIES: hypothetical protein [unclassified Serratia (in: enterobacteria)]
MKKTNIFMLPLIFTFSVASQAQSDPQGASTAQYYLLGQLNRCLSYSDFGLNESIAKELKNLSSRDKLLSDADRAITEEPPQFHTTTLHTWMAIYSRYEDGLDNITPMLEKDSFLMIDTCKSVIARYQELLASNVKSKPKS